MQLSAKNGGNLMVPHVYSDNQLDHQLVLKESSGSEMYTCSTYNKYITKYIDKKSNE